MNYAKAHKTKCSKCERKIIVSIHEFGVNHISGVNVTCGECMGDVDEEWEAANLKEAKKLSEWLSS